MARIRVETDIAAPPDAVWADVEDISTHVEWMHDAEAITFTSDTTAGVGTTFDCATKIGPIRLMDKMEITDWQPGEVMGVRHVGLVEGTGHFTLTPLGDDHTSFVWEEELRFPWWMGGPLGGIVGGRILKLVWKRNLRLLAERFA
ncbi:MAG: SRPBCC family protein [Acidimicrobiales bacterium]|nr:SRPBCC family protein [Acidimicrobiales bacterium]